MKLVFWIFSYNRGNFLLNCVRSIEQCAPGASIHIYDDNSDDADTLATLNALSAAHRVHTPQTDATAKNKHGGLYANMQAAYELCQDEDLVCFLQDDTQLVRPIDPEEVNNIRAFLTKQGPRFVQCNFMKGCNKKRDQAKTHFNKQLDVYFVDRFSNSAGAFYSDICLFLTQQLRAVHWRFEPRESTNEQQAKQHFKQMAYWRNPFCAWLPYVPAFRGKKQSWALRRAHKKRRCGFYPITNMLPTERQNFMARAAAQIPYAEDFLNTETQLPKPWIYYPLQGKTILKHLNSIELAVRKRLSR